MNKTLNRRLRQKQKSRDRILKAAAVLFRQQGLDATGIDEIMKKAGLTAGAFYAHFKSKDHLIEEVIWSSVPFISAKNNYEFMRIYLSVTHRDHPDRGCPIATLGSDLARAGKRLKNRTTDRLRKAIENNVKSTSPEKRRRALAAFSLALGALILSRITEGSELSDEFLDCYR